MVVVVVEDIGQIGRRGGPDLIRHRQDKQPRYQQGRDHLAIGTAHIELAVAQPVKAVKI